MHKPTLFLIAAVAPFAQAENAISYQTLKYHESDDRIDVLGSALTVDHDFGTDYHAKMAVDYDSVSGATPSWQPKAGYIGEYEQSHTTLADEARNGVNGSVLIRDKHRNEYSLGAGWSQEPDFIARQLSAQGQLYQDDSHNRSFTLGAGVLMNTAIATLHTNNQKDEDSRQLSVLAGASQTINRSSTAEFSLYYGYDSGFLSNQYLKIVRVDAATGLKALANDDRPDLHKSGGMATRYIKSLSNALVANLFYRYYQDDWGITAHSVDAKVYFDLTPTWRLNPALRLHHQTQANFYRAYAADINTFASTGVGSNDARLGDFNATTLQLNVEYRPAEPWSLNIGASDYRQDNGFQAHWLTAGFSVRY